MTKRQKPRLLVFNLATDADHPVLGFTTLWLNRLADRCEHLDVVTMQAGRLDLPGNVRVFSVGRERGYSEARRFLEFYRILIPLLLKNRYDACFAHMMPLFAAMGGPLLFLSGVRTTLWYIHRQVTRQLRFGLAMSWRAVSATESSFPLQTAKLRPVGHGIDVDFFSPPLSKNPAARPIIVQVGRLMEIKHQDTLLRAAAELDAQIVLVGGVLEGFSDEYRRFLYQLVDELNLAERVIFAGDLPPENVREEYRRADIAVNLTPLGSFDKAVLEGMACGLPSIVCNPAFDPLLAGYTPLLRCAAFDDVEGLRGRLRQLLAVSPEERAEIGRVLREGVVAGHGLEGLLDRVMDVLQYGDIQPHHGAAFSTETQAGIMK